MGDKTSLDAQAHKTFLTFTLDLYGRSWRNVVALVGENCDTNKRTARLANVLFLGCVSYGFNRTVMEEVVKESQVLFDKVHKLMFQRRNLIKASKLRQITHFKPAVSYPRDGVLLQNS